MCTKNNNFSSVSLFKKASVSSLIFVRKTLTYCYALDPKIVQEFIVNIQELSALSLNIDTFARGIVTPCT